MTSSPFSNGSGTKVLTEPLLTWLDEVGQNIFQSSLGGSPHLGSHLIATNGPSVSAIDEISRGLCKLLVALGDHSVTYIASHLSSRSVQTFLRVFLGYTGFPGWYGIDEEESEVIEVPRLHAVSQLARYAFILDDNVLLDLLWGGSLRF